MRKNFKGKGIDDQNWKNERDLIENLYYALQKER